MDKHFTHTTDITITELPSNVMQPGRARRHFWLHSSLKWNGIIRQLEWCGEDATQARQDAVIAYDIAARHGALLCC